MGVFFIERDLLPVFAPSERKAQHELHLAWSTSANRRRGVRARDLAERGAFGGVGPCHARVAELGAVENVEYVGTKADRSAFA